MNANPRSYPDKPKTWVKPVLPLSKTEEEILKLYDRLQELKLELALLQAHGSYREGNTIRTIKAELADMVLKIV